MRVFPLSTWRSRRKAIRTIQAAKTSLHDAVKLLNGTAKFSKEFRELSRSLRLRAGDAERHLDSLLSANQSGNFMLPDLGHQKRAIEAINLAIESERAFEPILLEAIASLEKAIGTASGLALDQARLLHRQALDERQRCLRMRKTINPRDALRQISAQSRKITDQIYELAQLVEASAKAMEVAERIALLPLPPSLDYRRRRESLLKHAHSVQEAHSIGKAFALRNNWRRFESLRIEIERESQVTVERARKEIDSWLTDPELTPRLFERFQSNLLALRNEPQRSDFLETWTTLRSEMSQFINAGFYAHWSEITAKLTNRRSPTGPSWRQVEIMAKQVRSRAMPPLYK